MSRQHRSSYQADSSFKPILSKCTHFLNNIYLIFCIEWLDWHKKDPNFEDYPDILLAETLREFFGSVKSKQGKEYSKSSMINLRSGLNRYLTYPPNSRIINLMHNDIFQRANLVFKGRLRKNKQEGNDVSQPRSDIAPDDLAKIYDNYFTPGLRNGNTEVLLHKVFFDIMYHTGRRGKEGLRNLTKNSFKLKKAQNGREFIEITFNEVTKNKEAMWLYAELFLGIWNVQKCQNVQILKLLGVLCRNK